MVLWPASSHVQVPQSKRTTEPDYKPHICPHTKQHTHTHACARVRSHYGSMVSLFRCKTLLSSRDHVHPDLVIAKNWRRLYTSQSHFISMILINTRVLQKEVKLSGEKGGMKLVLSVTCLGQTCSKIAFLLKTSSTQQG